MREIHYFKDAVYYSQVNNVIDPHGTCGPTSVANGLSCHGHRFPDRNGLKMDDQISDFLKSQYAYDNWAKVLGFRPDPNASNPRNWSQMLAWAANEMSGEKLAIWQELTIDEVKQRIIDGFVCIIGGDFVRGQGHFILIKGLEVDANWNIINFIVADPAGNMLTGYRDRAGNNLRYPFEKIKVLAWERRNNRTGRIPVVSFDPSKAKKKVIIHSSMPAA